MAVRAAVVALLCATGCTITNKTIAIGQKTSLERQLMGEVEPLTEEEILASSVRGQAGGVGQGSIDDLRARALAARQRQLFNRDDIEELKQAGCLGEGRDAKVAVRPCERASNGEATGLRERLIGEENADRQAIIEWTLATDPVLTAADRPQIEALYGAMLRQAARPGEWVQADDGAWTKR